MPNALIEEAHARLAVTLHAGDAVIDATVGNGHDTLHLAQCVGESGHVFGFDIQEPALARTSKLLDEAGCAGRVQLFHANHEEMASYLPLSLKGSIGAAVFNLGYLPGGDKAIVTRAETTLTALDTAWSWLKESGLMTIVAYPGHAEGARETQSVRMWIRDKHRTEGIAEERHSEFASSDSPVLLIASKFTM